MKTRNILLFMTILLFGACANNNDNAAITGNWTGISWKIDGQESGRDAAAVTFTFNPSESYEASFSEQKEEGTFRLVGTKLYTTATGKAEKMVQVRLQGLDTLIMDMNRVGTLEELVLVRQ